MASFGKHLHAKQNSKLAKYAEPANFAYLSKQIHNKCKNAKGLRPFKRSEPKNLRHKRTTSAKNAKGLRLFKRSKPKHLRHKHTTSAKTRQGFDLSKHPNQKGHIKCKAKANRMPRKNWKMDARKGEGTFFSTRTFGTHHSIYPKQKELRPSRTTARKKWGRRFFTKNKVSSHCLVGKQILYRNNKHFSKKYLRATTH